MFFNADTKLFAVIGFPVKHSFSPVMHNAWFKDEKLNCLYLAAQISPKDLKQAFKAFKTLGFCGINVTVPHKNAAVKCVDFADDSVKAVGSLNTVAFKNGKLYGYNTDYCGFADDLKEKKAAVKNSSVFVYGAGGAAKAVIYALKKAGAKKISAANRTFAKAQSIARRFKVGAVKNAEIAEAISQADLIVNASSCGMNKTDALPFKPSSVKKDAIVYDLIYNKQTPFKIFAKRYNLKFFSGEGMLARQGAQAFKIWTGIYPDTKKASRLLKKFMR
ncbi:MAG: shikimate dehydrogenase [Endomicrobium sp.]|jgi:shikimate dehydrogenase|nr:shikimate dehydrogenase [Endomicrobium sp.]